MEVMGTLQSLQILELFILKIGQAVQTILEYAHLHIRLNANGKNKNLQE
tara:strand:- start:422 stop:568 length:147 start_codon:yes stop_codon:yes gene_type:complete